MTKNWKPWSVIIITPVIVLKLNSPLTPATGAAYNKLLMGPPDVLSDFFYRTITGKGPATERTPRFFEDPDCRDLILFCEYFDEDAGKGLGASHQTGLTALVVRCI